MCELNGISFRLSCPYSSPQNGKAERKIRSINNIIRTLLIHASIPPSFWQYALEMASYISNILPSKSITFQSPVSMLYNKNPSYTYLRIFGCLCFPLFPSSTSTNSNLAPHHVYFLGIRQTIADISVLIWQPTKLSFVVMSYLMSLLFPMQSCTPLILIPTLF